MEIRKTKLQGALTVTGSFRTLDGAPRDVSQGHMAWGKLAISYLFLKEGPLIE